MLSSIRVKRTAVRQEKEIEHSISAKSSAESIDGVKNEDNNDCDSPITKNTTNQILLHEEQNEMIGNHPSVGAVASSNRRLLGGTGVKVRSAAANSTDILTSWVQEMVKNVSSTSSTIAQTTTTSTNRWKSVCVRICRSLSLSLKQNY